MKPWSQGLMGCSVTNVRFGSVVPPGSLRMLWPKLISEDRGQYQAESSVRPVLSGPFRARSQRSVVVGDLTPYFGCARVHGLVRALVNFVRVFKLGVPCDFGHG